MERAQYRVSFSFRFNKIIDSLKRKKPSLFNDLQKSLHKIIKEPGLGKPLRNVLKNRRRVHLGSFVLVYEIVGDELRFIDFDHHDRVYKKY